MSAFDVVETFPPVAYLPISPVVPERSLPRLCIVNRRGKTTAFSVRTHILFKEPMDDTACVARLRQMFDFAHCMSFIRSGLALPALPELKWSDCSMDYVLSPDTLVPNNLVMEALMTARVLSLDTFEAWPPIRSVPISCRRILIAQLLLMVWYPNEPLVWVGSRQEVPDSVVLRVDEMDGVELLEELSAKHDIVATPVVEIDIDTNTLQSITLCTVRPVDGVESLTPECVMIYFRTILSHPACNQFMLTAQNGFQCHSCTWPK